MRGWCAAGQREWPAIKAWLGANLQPSLQAWFGSVEVVYEGKAPPPPDQKYVFGYHPHGLFPIGASFLLPSQLCAALCFYKATAPQLAPASICNLLIGGRREMHVRRGWSGLAEQQWGMPTDWSGNASFLCLPSCRSFALLSQHSSLSSCRAIVADCKRPRGCSRP